LPQINENIDLENPTGKNLKKPIEQRFTTLKGND